MSETRAGAEVALNWRWIDSDAAFAELCSEAQQAGQVALDTEFERTQTFYPKLALLQFAVGDVISLVDPLALQDPSPLQALLADPHVTKVMHAVGEDLEVLQTWCGEGLEVHNLVDTQLAAAFVGERYGISYRELVAIYFEVALDKGATRSDWLARPLTAEQCRYAAMDVVWLLPAWQQLQQQITQAGRLGWLEEECKALVAAAATRPAPEQMWRLVKRAATLDRRGTAALQQLAAWRERRARQQDLPRSWVLRDEQLLALAEQRPERLADLRGKPLPRALRSGTAASELESMLASIRELSEHELPAPLAVLDRAQGEALQGLRKQARRRAEELGLAEELLARKRLLEPLFLDDAPALPVALQGWRNEVLGSLLEKWRS